MFPRFSVQLQGLFTKFMGQQVRTLWAKIAA